MQLLAHKALTAVLEGNNFYHQLWFSSPGMQPLQFCPFSSIHSLSTKHLKKTMEIKKHTHNIVKSEALHSMGITQDFA